MSIIKGNKCTCRNCHYILLMYLDQNNIPNNCFQTNMRNDSRYWQIMKIFICVCEQKIAHMTLSQNSSMWCCKADQHVLFNKSLIKDMSKISELGPRVLVQLVTYFWVFDTTHINILVLCCPEWIKNCRNQWAPLLLIFVTLSFWAITPDRYVTAHLSVLHHIGA